MFGVFFLKIIMNSFLGSGEMSVKRSTSDISAQGVAARLGFLNDYKLTLLLPQCYQRLWLTEPL